MIGTDGRGAASDPLGLEAAAALARHLSGCDGACIRLANDGLGRPGIRFFPDRADAADLPAAFLPHDMAPVPGAAELSGLGFWAGLPLYGTEGDVIGLLGVFDSENRKLDADVMDSLLGVARMVSVIVTFANATGSGAILPAPSATLRACANFEAFARLRIGEMLHDIGRCKATDRMAFRPTGSVDSWNPLMNGFEDGWPEVAAEIIARTRNATRDYIRMHMIRDRDADVTPGERQYDLYGMLWRVRGTVDAAEVWHAETDWIPFDTAPVAESSDPRDLAAQALVSTVRDLDDRIGADVQGWARRLAQGAQISPILSAVA